MPEARQFRPVPTFYWDINRTKRSHQVHWLAPLLETPEGRVWFLEKLECPCTPEEAGVAAVFHLCLPLRDIFTEDYYRCQGEPHLEDQFIAYYNRLFGLPEDFGVQDVWRVAPGNTVRHPAARGRGGWYEDLLREHVSDETLYARARDVRQILGTEADIIVLSDRHVTLVECKFKGKRSRRRYERYQMIGNALARRLDKEFYFGMVVEERSDPYLDRMNVSCVLWADVQLRLMELQREAENAKRET